MTATTRTRARAGRAALLVAVLALGACTSVSMPKVSMPSLPVIGKDEPPADAGATPRDLLGAKLVNPKADPDTPSMTVGKMIEFADRYLACDCAKTRFVRSWEKTPDGYRLQTNSGVVKPMEFVCTEVGAGKQCFLLEIDRGRGEEDLAGRFVPGSEFIGFLYENGVRCERETPCP